MTFAHAYPPARTYGKYKRQPAHGTASHSPTQDSLWTLREHPTLHRRDRKGVPTAVIMLPARPSAIASEERPWERRVISSDGPLLYSGFSPRLAVCHLFSPPSPTLTLVTSQLPNAVGRETL